MQDLFHKLLILRSPGIGPVKYNTLVQKFGSVAAVVDAIAPGDNLRDAVLREMDAAQKSGVVYLTDDDARYPQNLRAIKNHPVVLTARGNTDALNRPAVGMVGTRHATGAGLMFISDLANKFAENNYSVVSGMAIGTDTAAHTGALRASGNAVTVAVLAGGVDYIWPLENESLYYQIIERGCVISEMPVGFIPSGPNFAQRNRGIAALSDKLILGEADVKSGSMHTARFAIDYKKQVFAIPSHPSDARSVGPNSLIRDGLATLCMGINDFFDVNQKSKIKSQKSENPVLDALGIIPLSESVLAGLVKKSIMETKTELVVLELQGLIRKVDGGYVKN